MRNAQTKTFSVIGAGNAGHVFAAHLSMMGNAVCLFDVDEDKIEKLNWKKTISMEGALEGEYRINVITSDIQTAIEYSDVIIVILPTVYHRDIANSAYPYLRDGQVVLLTPGGTGGALEFVNILKEHSCTKDVTVAETNSMLYAGRSKHPGFVHVFGIKKEIYISCIPAKNIWHVIESIQDTYPQFSPVANVLHTSLNNTTAVVHPLPMILNAGKIESAENFEYYFDGFTESVSASVECLDSERVAIGAAFGLKLPSIIDLYEMRYGVRGNNLCETINKVEEYRGILAPDTLNSRYLFEDIPTGLVPLAMIGKAVGVATPVIDASIELGSRLLNRDFRSSGRSMSRLGIEGLGAQEILEFVS